MRPSTPFLRALPFLVMLTLAACGGGGSSTDTSTGGAGDDPARVARVRLVDAAPLFTAAGQQQLLRAQALDAEGRVLDVPLQWTSSAPQRVGVAGAADASAALTAGTDAGAAVVTATAGAHSASAVAVVVPAGPGVVALADAQIEGEPVAAPGLTALRPGSTYTLMLAAGVTAPPVGTRVIGQGTKAVAGEVVAVAGQQLTLALVPLTELLPALNLDIDLPLQAGEPRTVTQASRARIQSGPRERAQAETSFSIAGFECEAEGSAGGVTLAKKTVTPTGLDSLRYRVLWNSQQKLMRLSGQPGVQFELEPTASLTFSGKLDCKLELVDVPIPIPPALSLFIGVGFPVGVGFTLDGELPVNSVALNLAGEAQADVVVGFDCQAECTSLNSLTTSGSVTPTLIAPDFTANRLTLNGQVYAWANFEGGARWSSTLQFDAIEAQAGLKFATVFGTENAQAQDAASAGQYALTLEASASPTEALGDFASLVGLLLDQAKFEKSVPLGRSPTATLVASTARFVAGDALQFQVDLNADEVLFPLQGYNVQSVRVYRKTVAEDGSFVLVLANEVAASNGQTQFILPWVATVDSAANISFVAFVQTKLMSGLRWQVGLTGPMAAMASVNQFDGGDLHSCVVTSTGGVKCWGSGSTGQLGNNDFINVRSPIGVVGLTGSVTAVSLGGFHSCALSRFGEVKCWGQNTFGSLGNGTTTGSAVPVDVTGLSGGVTAVAAGGAHTCALRSSGAVVCWGRNQSGQLGDGTLVGATSPVAVSGLPGGVIAIGAGAEHTCALTGDSEVYCWGAGNFGQLGQGSFTGSPVPVKVLLPSTPLRALAVGGLHACVVTTSGGLWCWGSNFRGELGDGTFDNRALPAEPLGLTRGVRSVSLGNGHTCALAQSGDVLCMGSNTFGQLGNGSVGESPRPVAVVGLTGEVTAIGLGAAHSCATLGTGALMCWGSNTAGQLGNGGRVPSAVPVAVSGLP